MTRIPNNIRRKIAYHFSSTKKSTVVPYVPLFYRKDDLCWPCSAEFCIAATKKPIGFVFEGIRNESFVLLYMMLQLLLVW